MYQLPVLQQGIQLLKELLCATSAITLLLGGLGGILLHKSLLGRQGSDKEQADILRCASCGTAKGNEIGLKYCDLCDLVCYCSDECMQNHRPEHEAICNERAAEIRDEILFKQPECTHLGDCPICCLPLSLDPKKRLLLGCCSKILCVGCDYANAVRERDQKLDETCPFCRHIKPKTTEEGVKYAMKRAERNDPTALWQMGIRYVNKEEYDAAFEYFTRAADLGDAGAHYNLSHMYMKGQGVEKDEKKELYHMEEAAIAGHPHARHNLACCEDNKDRCDRAVKHWIIAANLGHDESIQALKECYKDGDISKDDFAAALRGHYAAVAATKSPQREFGEQKMGVGSSSGD